MNPFEELRHVLFVGSTNTPAIVADTGEAQNARDAMEAFAKAPTPENAAELLRAALLANGLPALAAATVDGEAVRTVMLLHEHTDIGIALVGAAILDAEMRDVLSGAFIVGCDDDALFGRQDAPAGPSGRRAMLLRALGLVSEVTRGRLDLLRRIRNRLAHDPGKLSFDSDGLRDQVDALCTVTSGPGRSRKDNMRSMIFVLMILVRFEGQTGLRERATRAAGSTAPA